MRRSVRGFLLVCLLGAMVTQVGGCVAQAAGHRDFPLDDEEFLGQAGLDEQGVWQSAPWTRSVWIPYPGRSTVTVFHGLSRLPTSVEVYISGDKDDRETPVTRNAYRGAGNIATITDVTDESVSLKNNTAGDFFIRLVLR